MFFLIQETEEQSQWASSCESHLTHRSLPVLISLLLVVSPSEMSYRRIKIKQMGQH